MNISTKLSQNIEVESKEDLRDMLDPKDALYWIPGIGKGGDTAWKFRCVCGEQCSSYENPLYHPQGDMFECTACRTWSHTVCVYGHLTNEDVEEMTDIMCHKCKCSRSREQR